MKKHFGAVPNMTHPQLVERAVSWLRGQSCCVALSELRTYADEIPDAVGWKAGKSILVECKVSRSDFSIDRLKSCRMRDYSIGMYRYYMVPHSLVSAEDVPDPWGLVYVGVGTRAYVAKQPVPVAERDLMAEILLLTSALRRIKGTCGVDEFDRLVKPGRRSNAE